VVAWDRPPCRRRPESARCSTLLAACHSTLARPHRRNCHKNPSAPLTDFSARRLLFHLLFGAVDRMTRKDGRPRASRKVGRGACRRNTFFRAPMQAWRPLCWRHSPKRQLQIEDPSDTSPDQQAAGILQTRAGRKPGSSRRTIAARELSRRRVGGGKVSAEPAVPPNPS